MKQRCLVAGAVLGAVVGAGFALWASRGKPVAPTLVVDRAPVSAAAAAAVFSYADALAASRPAVVSVYSTKYARQRGSAGVAQNDRRNPALPGSGASAPV